MAAAYMFGVAMDRIADDIFRLTFDRAGWAFRLAAPRIRLHGLIVAAVVARMFQRPASGTFRPHRLAVLHATGGLGTFLEYQRSRLRVARATAVNGAISLPAIVLCGEYAEIALLASIAMLVLIVASAFSAIEIQGAHEASLKAAYAFVREPGREP